MDALEHGGELVPDRLPGGERAAEGLAEEAGVRGLVDKGLGEAKAPGLAADLAALPAVARVMEHFAAQSPALDHTDGISADFGDWRFNLRSSNTEPLLRLNIETRADQALLDARTRELSDLLSA